MVPLSDTAVARGAPVVRPWSGDAASWDAFVEGDEQSSFCHLSAWRDIMADTLGARCAYLQAQNDDGSFAGVLPLLHVRSALTGRCLVSMPFLNYGGPLGSPVVREQLAREAIAVAQAGSAKLIELRTRYDTVPPLRERQPRVTVVLPLAARDSLWEGFPSKLRSQIRRSQKAGMLATFGNDQVDAFYPVFAQTMRDLGTPVLPRGFFHSIVAALGARTVIGVVRSPDGTPVAAGFGFEWKGEVEITWAGALRAFSREAPNMLLYWSFMEESLKRGAHTFNFGRCSVGGGTHRFKLQWGGHDAPLPWSVWPDDTMGLAGSDRGRFGVAVETWKRLPLRTANALGPLLARLLP